MKKRSLHWIYNLFIKTYWLKNQTLALVANLVNYDTTCMHDTVVYIFIFTSIISIYISKEFKLTLASS